MQRIEWLEALIISLGLAVGGILGFGLVRSVLLRSYTPPISGWIGMLMWFLVPFIFAFILATLADFIFRLWKKSDADRSVYWGLIAIGSLVFPIVFFVVLFGWAMWTQATGEELYLYISLVLVPSIASLIFVRAYINRFSRKK